MAALDIHNINLKVLIMDTDFYAMQAINSYLAWDRRTRVTNMCESVEAMWAYIDETPLAELPDVVVLDIDHLLGDAPNLQNIITRLNDRVDGVKVVCLSQFAELLMVEAAAESGAHGFLLKQDVRFQIAWAIVYAFRHDFIITHSVASVVRESHHPRLYQGYILPRQRKYPELTARIRQAIRLCVIEGMPAHLAADEMGISLHTIRGYIKEGYRILETYDETDYPVDMTPQERAFMRFTAFADDFRNTQDNSASADAIDD